MNSSHSNAKKVATNTLFLYARMALMMVVGFLTARVNLDSLGVDNYGIYSVVGGLVVMFTVLSGSITSAISRFITYELGAGNKENMQLVFSTSMIIQVLLSILLILLAETLGLWFINDNMNFPADRYVAANWVYQLSILSFVTSLLSVPYNATIIAHEKMAAFAYISIFEAFLKLLIAYFTYISPIDKLIFFASANCLVSLFLRNLYSIYCRKHFAECHFVLVFNSVLLKKMFSFAGWNFLGAGSLQLMTHGVNVLINMFFGVSVNAARGLAVTIENTVMSFVSNFTMAINPVITKSYASNDTSYMFELIYRGAKFSFFLLMFFALPCILEADMLLALWLKEVPPYTCIFLRLSLVASLISVLSNTMMTAMLAVGDIKRYQIIVGGLGMVVFPMTWILYKLGTEPQTTYFVVIVIYIIQFCVRLYLLKGMVGLSISDFVYRVLFRSLLVVFLVFIPTYMLYQSIPSTISSFFIICFTCGILSLVFIYLVGLDTKEKQYLINLIARKK